MSAGRVWFDVSFTRTQKGSIGITRTVRRLLTSPAPFGGRPGAVAFHRSGFRRVTDPDAAAHPKAGSERRSVGQKVFDWLNGALIRHLVVAAVKLLPWPLLRRPWRAFSRLTFSGLSRDDEPVRFEPGDLLVVADVAWNYPVWEAARAARQQGASVLLVVYDLMPIRRPDFCFPLAPKVFADFLREMLGCADAVLCISRATEDDLWRWAAEKRLLLPPTGHFYLGSDAVQAPAPQEAVRQEISAFLSSAGPCFAAVGSFEPKKNYALLLDVFERMWARGRPERLIIAGKETADCRRLLDRLHRHPEFGHRLLVLHDATDAEVAAIYLHCRALVFPSLFEGFGLPLVEARARGSRVIASDIPVFLELADPGVTLFRQGSLSDLENAVLGLCDDPGTAPGSVAGLTWAQSARQFYQVASQLAG